MESELGCLKLQKKKKKWWRRRKIEALVFLSQHLKIPYCSGRHKHLLPWLFVPLRRLRPVPLRPLVIMMHQVCNVWLCPFVYKYTWWEEKSLQCKVIISSKRHQASVFSLLCLFCLFLWSTSGQQQQHGQPCIVTHFSESVGLLNIILRHFSRNLWEIKARLKFPKCLKNVFLIFI